jgi:hypothetical protein
VVIAIRVVAGVLLLAHGLVHLLYLAPDVARITGARNSLESPDRCTLLLAAEHTRSASPYRLLYTALGIDEPEEPRTKPSCCDAEGQPPVDPDLVELFERGLRDLGRTPVRRCDERGNWRQVAAARPAAAALSRRFSLPELRQPAAGDFAHEIYKVPRSWAERAYPKLIYFNELDRGNHFAAWQEPGLFSAELRAAFRSLR